MKITVRELRSLINEALTSPSGAAVTVFKTPAICKIILWSPQKLGEILDEKGFDSYVPIDHSYEDPFIYGIIGLDRLKKSAAWNESGKGWEVVNCAAQKGYGPLMFNYALAEVGPYIPDRNTMTDDSARVWKKFSKGASPGAQLKPLDNEDKPKTPSKLDDGPVVKKGGTNDVFFDEELPMKLRNTALVGPGITFDNLKKTGVAAASKLCKKHKINSEEFNEFLDESARQFFESYFEYGTP